MNPLLLVDAYKVNHNKMYPEGMTKLYSNGTCRKSRLLGIDEVVVAGMQHFIKEYLIKKFNEEFFNKYLTGIIVEYKRHCQVDTTHIEELHDLGYLPIEIKSLEEGTLCPIGVPMLTITNTHPKFAWLVNYLETLISCSLWQFYTSATIAFEYKKLLTKYAIETTGSSEGVQWQGHDFSMRGMSSSESAIISGMGHLLSFTGTDTIPAIYQLEKSYNATGLIGASVPATEHSVMCMGTKDGEIESFKRLLDLYPNGILSVVSDTWDLWKVCTEYLPQLKEQILSRDGKLVIRPDSGDPVDIICGEGYYKKDWDCYVKDVPSERQEREGYWIKLENKPLTKGVIELLWDVFGGTINTQGYKVLDSHIGAIYGDSITLERAKQICERLKEKGFASINIVLGIGSYTYQYNTRDTFGFAMKATYGEITHSTKEINYPNYNAGIDEYIEHREIFKDPITDDGTKRSKKGLLRVEKDVNGGSTTPHLIVLDQQSWDKEKQGFLTTVFKDGKLTRETTLEEIRNRINSNIC